MKRRKSTGKKLRFEIFKRDGFRCVYCGVTPIQSVLRVDHVIPVAQGGTTLPENLVTSCHDCNAGKSATPLELKRLSKPMLNEADKDHAEQIREFLKVQKEIADARRQAAEEIAKHWDTCLGPMTENMFNRLLGLIQKWPIEKIIEAIEITARKLGRLKEFEPYHADKRAKYFHGILRKWSRDQEESLNGEGT